MNIRKISELDFTGQDIFIGLDICRKFWKASIVTEQFEHRTFTQPPSVEVLVSYLRRHFPGARYVCVYEAGFSGFWIHDKLKQHGVDCIVVNPADVPTTNKEQQTKTDRVDARKLARYLRSGDIKSIYVPTRTMLEDRSLIRTRYQFVKKQTRCKNQIKSLLHFYGIEIPEEVTRNHWSRRFLIWLENIQMERASGKQALKSLLEELIHLRATIASLTKRIRTLAQEEPYRQNVIFLRTIPGISTFTAMVLLTELIDINRFRSLDHLASYVGLIPGEHSSGEHEIITGITTRRNVFLRFLLIEAAWVAVRKDPALLMAFTKLCARMTKTNAIVHIARKLLNRVRYVLKNQREYHICTVGS